MANVFTVNAAAIDIYGETQNIEVSSISARRASSELLNYLEANNINVTPSDILSIEENNGVSSLKVTRVLNPTASINDMDSLPSASICYVEVQFLDAYDVNSAGDLIPTDIAIQASSSTGSYNWEIDDTRCDITVASIFQYKEQIGPGGSDLMWNIYQPYRVSFAYEKYSDSQPSHIDAGIVLNGVLCDEDGYVRDNEYTWQLVLAQNNPQPSMLYVKTQNSSNNWVRISDRDHGLTGTVQIFDEDGDVTYAQTRPLRPVP